jgi:uncharacterized membrane protein
MIEFTHQIMIAAPADGIWRALEDIPNWPRWTPTVHRVEAQQPGPIGVGARFRLHQPQLLPAVWSVTSWTPGRGFTWVSRAAGMTSTAEHVLANVEGGTQVTLRVTFEGLLAPVIAFLAGKLTTKYMELEAQGLKEFVLAQPQR